jgi:hypothetical protein
MNDKFPVLQGCRNRSIDAQKVDDVRRVLQVAFQPGALSEEEFANTLERLEFAPGAVDPALDSPSRRSARKPKCHTPTAL